jgi:hypothetical protein
MRVSRAGRQGIGPAKHRCRLERLSTSVQSIAELVHKVQHTNSLSNGHNCSPRALAGAHFNVRASMLEISRQSLCASCWYTIYNHK